MKQFGPIEKRLKMVCREAAARCGARIGGKRKSVDFFFPAKPEAIKLKVIFVWDSCTLRFKRVHA
jgi:hypothetical protein